MSDKLLTRWLYTILTIVVVLIGVAVARENPYVAVLAGVIALGLAYLATEED